MCSQINSDVQFSHTEWSKDVDLTPSFLYTAYQNHMKARKVYYVDEPTAEEFDQDYFMWAGFLKPGKTTLFLFVKGYWYERVISVPWRIASHKLPQLTEFQSGPPKCKKPLGSILEGLKD